ncbi:MAG: CARDB domain-containing protein [Thermoplasmata archaeon]
MTSPRPERSTVPRQRPERAFQKRRRHRLSGWLPAVLIAILLLPSLQTIPAGSPSSSDRAVGDSQDTEPTYRAIRDNPWPMFMRDPSHTSNAGSFARKLTDPLLLWSTETSIESHTMTIGNFTANIMLNATPDYGRRTLHIAFIDGGQAVVAEAATGVVMWQAPLTGTLLAAPTLTDFNGNGRQELVVVSSQGTVTCYEPILEWNGSAYQWNNTNLTSQRLWERSLGAEVIYSSPAVGDISGDGTPDLAVCAGATLYVLNGANGSVLWSAGLPGNLASSPVLLDYGGGGLWVAAQSFNGTITPFFLDKTYLTLFSNRGLESWNRSISLSTTFTTFTSLPSPVAADLTGDGFPELLILSPFESGSGRLHAFKQDGSPVWSPIQMAGQCEAPPAVGDLNNDSTPDIIVASWNFTLMTGNARVSVAAVDGRNGTELWTRTIDRTSDILMTERVVSAPALADLNRDGRSDIVLSLWNGRVEALDGKDGWDLWSYTSSARASVLSSPSIADAELDGFPEVFADGLALTERIGDLVLSPEDLVLSDDAPDEGDSVQVTAFVRNTGTKDLNNVSVLFTDVYDGTEVWSARAVVNVSARGSAGATVTWPAAGGGRHRMVALADPSNELEEVSEGNNGAWRELNVSSPYTLGASCGTNESYINAGEEAAYFVEVRNLGSVAQSVSVNVTRAPAHWTAALNPQRLELDPSESASVLVTVRSPSNASAGGYVVNVTAWSGESPVNRATVTLTTFIRGRYGVRISPAHCSTAVMPDDWALIRLTVTNVGNAADTITLDNTTPPADWRVFLSHYSVGLEGGASMILSASVKPPPYATEGDAATIQLIARSAGDPSQTDTATLQVVVAIPDLAVVDMRFLRADGVEADGSRVHLVENGSATVVLSVMNLRENVDVGGVRVVLEEGEISIGQESLGVLEKSAGCSVRIPWTPGEGRHYLSASVDPENAIKETDETNNILSAVVDVKSRYPSGPYVLSGTVYKRGGVPVSGASVVVSNLRTMQNVSLTTNGLGKYSTELSAMPGGYQEEDRVMLTATDGLTTCSTTLLVYSEDGGKTVDLFLIPGPYDFFMAAERTQLNTDPQIPALYKIWLTNVGSKPNTLLVNYSTLPQGWTAALLDSSGKQASLLTLAPNQTDYVQLGLTPPATARAGSRAGVRVTATSLNESSVSRYIDTVTTVNQVFGVALEASQPPRLSPGASGSASLTIRNAGNGNDTFDLSVSAPAGIATELDSPSAQLGPFEETVVRVNLTLSLSLHPGTYNLTALARSRYSPAVLESRADIRVVVEPFTYRVVVTGGVGSLQQEEYGSVNFTARNTGNVRETFLLSVRPDSPSSLPGDWSYSIRRDGAQVSSVTLDPDESVRLELRVEPPAETPGISRVNFNLTASSTSDPSSSHSSLLSLAIERPDLYIERTIQLSPTGPRAGERTRLSVSIRNQGFWDSPPVLVRFYDGERILAEVISQPVPFGSAVEVQTEWKAVAGGHTIKAVVNPEHPSHTRVKELSYANNEVSRYVQVGEGGAEVPWGALAALAVVLAAASAGYILYSRRGGMRKDRLRRRGGGPAEEGYEEEEGEGGDYGGGEAEWGDYEEGGEEGTGHDEEEEGSEGDEGAEGPGAEDEVGTAGDEADESYGRGGGAGEEGVVVGELVEEEGGVGPAAVGEGRGGREREGSEFRRDGAVARKRKRPPPEARSFEMPSVIRIG